MEREGLVLPAEWCKEEEYREFVEREADRVVVVGDGVVPVVKVDVDGGRGEE